MMIKNLKFQYYSVLTQLMYHLHIPSLPRTHAQTHRHTL